MERLTKWLNDKKNLCIKECVEKYTECHKCEPFKDVMKRLAEYEDAEEQGLLLRLPCKVGDTVYCIFSKRTKCTEHNQEFDEYNCLGCECLECDSRKEKYVQEMKAYRLDWIVDNLDRFGKTVFLTKEEAEQELANRQQSHAEAIMDERNGR